LARSGSQPSRARRRTHRPAADHSSAVTIHVLRADSGPMNSSRSVVLLAVATWRTLHVPKPVRQRGVLHSVAAGQTAFTGPAGRWRARAG
jgi:alkyl hydroperoxide reductase subunit AhpF